MYIAITTATNYTTNTTTTSNTTNTNTTALASNYCYYATSTSATESYPYIQNLRKETYTSSIPSLSLSLNFVCRIVFFCEAATCHCHHLFGRNFSTIICHQNVSIVLPSITLACISNCTNRTFFHDS